MKNTINNDMYCIVHYDDEFGYTCYLAWQNPGWNDDGYFWTDKETFKECLCENTEDHPFLFDSRAKAIAHLKSLSVPQKCSIVRWVAENSMNFREFMNMYDNWNGVTRINDNNLHTVVVARTLDIMECMPVLSGVENYKELFEKEVVSFGFYDEELCVRVR